MTSANNKTSEKDEYITKEKREKYSNASFDCMTNS